VQQPEEHRQLVLKLLKIRLYNKEPKNLKMPKVQPMLQEKYQEA
jgi:hypothetical protein